jgi:hypothetical protein
MTLRKRIERLDRGNARSAKAPLSIVLYGVCPDTSERISAGIASGAHLTRESCETENDFMARVTYRASQTIFLPDNGR